MRRSVTVTFVLLLLMLSMAPSAAAGGGGFFNIHCEFSHRAKDDPIVHPGDPGAGEQHDFIGNRSTDAFSKRRTMVGARTSCDLSADTSAYWTPTLLDDAGNPVPILEVLVYYRAAENTVVQPFARNLKIITGGDTTDPPAPSRSQMSLSWACGDTAPYTASPPNCTGTGWYVSAHVHFPDCWDGQNKDSEDHRSHMVFGTPECPPGWVAVPRLRLHVKYDVIDARGFMLSSDIMLGTPSGHSLHADFWNTWDQSALRFLVDRCVNAGQACSEMTDAKLRAMGFHG